MIDPKIYTVLKVVETGNYSRAANELGLSQPAVSQHIHAIESELNIHLFERTGMHLKLTRQGEKVVKYARSMVALDIKLRKELQDEENGITSLNIGITHTVEANRITEVFAKYIMENSGVTMRLITDTQAHLLQKIKNYEADFAIIDSAFHDPSLISMPLDTDSLVLIVPPSHELALKSMVTINDVRSQKLILRLPNSGTRDLFMAALEGQNMSIEEFNVILEMDNVATIKDLVRHGYGASVLARSACQSEIRKKKLVALPIENLSMNREIDIVYPNGFEHMDILKKISAIYHEQ